MCKDRKPHLFPFRLLALVTERKKRGSFRISYTSQTWGALEKMRVSSTPRSHVIALYTHLHDLFPLA